MSEDGRKMELVWVSNVGSGEHDRMHASLLLPREQLVSEWIESIDGMVGEPKPTEKYSADELKKMGMTGVYLWREQDSEEDGSEEDETL